MTAAAPPVEERFTLLLQKLALSDLQASISAEIGPPPPAGDDSALDELDDLLGEQQQPQPQPQPQPRPSAPAGDTTALDELDALLQAQQ